MTPINGKRKLFALWGVLASIYICCLAAGLIYGRYPVTGRQIVDILIGNAPKCDNPDVLKTIVLDLRLPRLLTASIVGAALACAGGVFQGLLRNPLADPFTLGVSTGAAFGATVALIAGMSSGIGIPAAAMCGALAALAVVLLLSRDRHGLKPASMILAGIVVSTFLSALISLMKSLDEESLASIVFWMLGSFGGRDWLHVIFAFPYFALGFLVVLAYARDLDLLSMGELEAKQLGVPVQRSRLVLMSASCVMTAAAVSVSGVIGFVGLVVPHMVRLLQGPKHAQLVISSAIMGATVTVLADLLAKNLLASGEELPVGVLTTLIGGPFFCYLLWQKKRFEGDTFGSL